ncbi:hypothetical protein [uncultured Streptomyces sp.]|uniref:hypothetical protein n=1 Tax=uncultured Streptomyces sp. TaxID=174707 RepID=UPI002603D3B7|nr:hypothetical protein [uncultured Streptomyces sp.]
MGHDGTVWALRRGPEQAGDILIDDADFPWLRGRFTPGPAYDAVTRDLFARELDLSQRFEEDERILAEWDEVCGAVNALLTLHRPDGAPVADFLLHIEGDRAAFRWADD